jgi:hypothetical protein
MPLMVRLQCLVAAAVFDPVALWLEGDRTTGSPKPVYSLAQIQSKVWALAFVSMLMDISSEMIHALLRKAPPNRAGRKAQRRKRRRRDSAGDTERSIHTIDREVDR